MIREIDSMPQPFEDGPEDDESGEFSIEGEIKLLEERLARLEVLLDKSKEIRDSLIEEKEGIEDSMSKLLELVEGGNCKTSELSEVKESLSKLALLHENIRNNIGEINGDLENIRVIAEDIIEAVKTKLSQKQ